MDSHNSSHDRLWTPWRMRYIGGDAREAGCIFCNRLRAKDDVASLILRRSERSFVIMNLFPYNTGHVMVVPNDHASELDRLDEPTLAEMATILPRVVTALRRVLGCDGFNIGLNVGAVAGAGVADHLHQHVVPRWQGDANFMPILAGTMVIPEMIPTTYAKVRAELQRALVGSSRFDVIVLSDSDRPRVWLQHGRIPVIDVGNDVPAWQVALAAVGAESAEIVGWSGATSATDSDVSPGLVVRLDTRPSGEGWHDMAWEPANPDSLELSPRERATMARVGHHLAPWIASRET